MPRLAFALVTTLSLNSAPTSANFAPEDDLYLVCGSYLVYVTTTWKQKASNAIKAQGDYRSLITADVEPLHTGKEASYPEATTRGWAFEETITVGKAEWPGDSWMLDRIEGTLIRTTDPSWDGPDFFDERKPYREVVAACRMSTEAEQRRIVDAHNRNVTESKLERKF